MIDFSVVVVYSRQSRFIHLIKPTGNAKTRMKCTPKLAFHQGKTVTLKLKTVGFEVRTRAQTLLDHTNSVDVILEAALDLLKGEIQACHPQPLRLRLMGKDLPNLLRKYFISVRN